MWNLNQINVIGTRNFFNLRKALRTSFLLGVLLIIFSFNPHPYHVSYTEINYKKETNNLTFAIEIFTDDLETAIKLDYKPKKLFLGSELSDSAEFFIQQYVTHKTSIIIDGIVLRQFQFLPTESNSDRTTIYFEFTDLPHFKSLAFYNEILINTFTNQQNIVEFIHSGKREKALLAKNKTSATWILE